MISVFMNYANPHVMGWLLELKKIREVNIGIQYSVTKYRKGYFMEQDDIEGINYFFKVDGKKKFLEQLLNSSHLISLGLFNIELLKWNRYLRKDLRLLVLSEPFNPVDTKPYTILRNIYCRIFRLKYNSIDFLAIGGRAVKEYYDSLGFTKSDYYNFGYFPSLKAIKDFAGTEKNESINFLYVGQLIERKGIISLLKTASLLAKENYVFNWSIDIIGDGILRKDVEARVKPFSQIRYHGLISDTKKMNLFYQKADVLIIPSIFDGWGAVVNEAISKGCAIIAAKNVYSAKSLVSDGENGYIFGNRKEMLCAIINYINNPIQLKSHKKKSLDIFDEWNHMNAARSVDNFLNENENDNLSLLQKI